MGPELCRQTLRRSRKGLETLPEVWNWSGDPPGSSKVVGRPSRRFGSGRERLLEIQKWLETLPEVRKSSEAILDVRIWSGDPPGVPELIVTPSRRSGSGRRPYRRFASGWETFLEVQRWSETLAEVRRWLIDPPRDPEVVGRPFWRCGTGRKTFPQV